MAAVCRFDASIVQVLAYEANIEAAVLAQEGGTVPLPEDYSQFIPKVGDPFVGMFIFHGQNEKSGIGGFCRTDQ